MTRDDVIPNEEESLEVVRTAARITFGEEVTEDQCVQLHDLIRHGFRLKGLDMAAREDVGDTVRAPEGIQEPLKPSR